MKKIYALIILVIIFFSVLPSFCKDYLNFEGDAVEGKIDGITSNLVVFKKDGCTKNYIRLTPKTSYSDIVLYHNKMFSKDIVEIMGYIYYLDSFNIKMYVSDGGFLELPRYRIKDIVVKIR